MLKVDSAPAVEARRISRRACRLWTLLRRLLKLKFWMASSRILLKLPMLWRKHAIHVYLTIQGARQSARLQSIASATGRFDLGVVTAYVGVQLAAHIGPALRRTASSAGKEYQQ